MAETIIRLVVTSPLLIEGEHVPEGVVFDAPKDKAYELLASGRVRRAQPGEGEGEAEPAPAQ
jgi:hypothetical protein